MFLKISQSLRSIEMTRPHYIRRYDNPSSPVISSFSEKSYSSQEKISPHFTHRYDDLLLLVISNPALPAGRQV
jgi:hypothetical protein